MKYELITEGIESPIVRITPESESDVFHLGILFSKLKRFGSKTKYFKNLGFINKLPVDKTLSYSFNYEGDHEGGRYFMSNLDVPEDLFIKYLIS